MEYGENGRGIIEIVCVHAPMSLNHSDGFKSYRMRELLDK